MNKTEKKILEVIQSIEGSGSFMSSGNTDFLMPGLQISKLGEVPFPITANNAKSLIAVAEKAPFGKGSKTVTDTSVRSVWEIDASKIKFKNKAWTKKISSIIEVVKEDLGIEEHKVKASLYKLLIYEEGDFFLSHIDSEKEKGMFGTLVVGLPSAHTGGELVVRFDGRETSVSFEKAANNYEIPYVAFYADCEHELKPVTKGYRVCLTYNLVQSSKKKINSPQFGNQVIELTKLMKTWAKSTDSLPGIAMLDHQYTPANMSVQTLKHHDLPRAQALLLAAEKADFHASLGLVSHYQMGQLEGVDNYDDYYGRNSYYDDEEEEDSDDGYTGEIYDEYTKLIGLAEEEDTPSLGEIAIHEDKLIGQKKLGGEDDPIQKEAEGYTGNAGMTMEYWYHYGAVSFWPKNKHADLLIERPISIKVNWLKYYLNAWKNLNEEEKAIVEKLLIGISIKEGDDDEIRRFPKDLSAYAGALVKVKKPALFEICRETLALGFDKIKVQKWLDLLRVYEHNLFIEVFELAIEKGKINTLVPYFKLLATLFGRQSKRPSPFIFTEIEKIPDYIERAELIVNNTEDRYYHNKKDRKEQITSVLNHVLLLSKYKEKDSKWLESCVNEITKNASRKQINQILVPLVYKPKEGKLYNLLQQFCLSDLQKRTASEPEPPKTWKRTVPDANNRNAAVWEILRDFMESPTDTVFDFSANQAKRSIVRGAIYDATVDLKTETIKKGSPHTLRITKTQKAYEQKLLDYKQDLKLLAKFKMK